MGTILQIFVLVAVLGGIALAAMCYKTMRIYNIILMVLVLFAALAFNVLAAKVLKTHEGWMKLAKAKEDELAQLVKKNQELANGLRQPGQPVVPGIRQLRLEIRRIALDRGGVWYDVVPTKILKAETGAVAVSIDAPEPHGLSEKMLVFIFDANRYLGEFQVTKADAKSKSVELAPNLPLTAEELKLESASRGPWTLYQMMPLDNAAVLAKLPPNEREELLRNVDRDKLAAVVEELGDPNRKLRNYQAIFHHNNQQVSLLKNEIGRIVMNTNTTKTAMTRLDDEIKSIENQKADLESDLKNFQHEQAAIAAYADKLQQRVTLVRNYLRAVYAATTQTAADFRTWQLNAAEEINRQLDSAQASAGSPPRP